MNIMIESDRHIHKYNKISSELFDASTHRATSCSIAKNVYIEIRLSQHELGRLNFLKPDASLIKSLHS